MFTPNLSPATKTHHFPFIFNGIPLWSALVIDGCGNNFRQNLSVAWSCVFFVCVTLWLPITCQWSDASATQRPWPLHNPNQLNSNHYYRHAHSLILTHTQVHVRFLQPCFFTTRFKWMHIRRLRIHERHPAVSLHRWGVCIFCLCTAGWRRTTLEPSSGFYCLSP